MAKPTVKPRWANSGGSVSTPSSGKQDIGWVPGEKPRAQWKNWLAIHTYNWIDWLDQQANSSDEWIKGVLANTGLHVKVQGTGKFKHGAESYPLPASAFYVEAGTATLGDGRWTFLAVSQITAPICIPAGRRITNVTLVYNRGGAGNVTMTLRNRSYADVGGAVPNGSITISAGTGFTTAQFAVAPNYTIGASEFMFLRVQCDNAANVIVGADVGYDFL